VGHPIRALYRFELLVVGGLEDLLTLLDVVLHR